MRFPGNLWCRIKRKTGESVLRCSGVPVFRCSGVRVFRCSGVRVFGCSGVVLCVTFKVLMNELTLTMLLRDLESLLCNDILFIHRFALMISKIFADNI